MSVLLSDLMRCLCRVMDWMNPALVTHQLRVAFIARQLAAEMALSDNEQRLLLLGGMLHDIGTLSMKERLGGAEPDHISTRSHSELGFLLLRDCRTFAEVAHLIRNHHTPWKGTSQPLPLGRLSNVLYLAERIDTLVGSDREILGQVGEICTTLRQGAGRFFAAEHVEALESVAGRDFFWFSISPDSVKIAVQGDLRALDQTVTMDEMLEVSRVFSHIIDFRCRHTATHSSGVAGTAEALAAYCGFSEEGCRDMKIAGYLHDLGKLTVPATILNKPGKLNRDEFNIVKQHPFRTYQCLQGIRGLEEITLWAALHHERLGSDGYPFRHEGKTLPLGSRIVAVADVFTALTEDRPYRRGLKQDEAMKILWEMVGEKALDGEVVHSLAMQWQAINQQRLDEQARSASSYIQYDNAANVAAGYCAA